MNRKILSIGLLFAAIGMSSPLAAAPIIVNGGFESGFTGWTRVDQVGSDGTFFVQSGTSSPVSGFPVPPPPEGTNAAMTDAEGPGAHVLYQDFMVTAPASSTTMLMFDLFVGNRDDMFVTPNMLAFDTPALNQQARVDILRSGTDPFSLSAGDLLLNAFRTNVGDPLVSGYSSYAIDVSGLLAANTGANLRLRFAETDNVNVFNFGVDNVRFVDVQEVPVPEPATLALVGSGLAAAYAGRRKRRQ
jgi:hypothetical protein